VDGRLATVRLAGADRTTARAWMAELLAQHPQDDAVLLEATRQARRDGRFELALQYLRQVGVAAPVSAVPAAVPAALTAAPGEVPLLVPRDPLPAAAAPPSVAIEPAQRARDRAAARSQIDEIEARRQPRVETGWVAFSRRSSPGISTLRGSELPIVAVWAPGYDGHWFAQLDAVHLDADNLPARFEDAALFGKVRALAGGQDLAAPVAQLQSGLSAGFGWRGEDQRWDIGVIGAGLKVPNLVGGWREAGTWRGNDWSAEVSRRPLTGSLLSYAGAADPITGEVWGGVVNNALSLRLAHDLTPVLSASASLRAGVLTGRKLRSNPMLQWRNTIDREWRINDDLRLSAGLAFSVWHYRHNEGFYTFGLGGYYSPQRYVSLALPVQAQGRWGRWSFDVRASVSRSSTHEDDVPYYPSAAALQAASGNTIHRGGDGGGFGYSLRGNVEYWLTPHLSVGTSIDIDRSDSYAPTRGMFYLRYLFPPLVGAVPVPPRPVLPYSQY
jgi:cellulose synthase operon protein C